MAYKEYNIHGITVGYHIDGRYRTMRDSLKHFYIKEKGYPVSDLILRDLKANDCKEVLIIEKRSDGTQRAFLSKFSDWMDCEAFQEEGFDKQRCLPLSKQTEV
jgi:hypothetical protein